MDIKGFLQLSEDVLQCCDLDDMLTEVLQRLCELKQICNPEI